jgi:hypothetical protein
LLPENCIWIFNGEGGQFPAGAFTSRPKAEKWIATHRVSGTLTAYPVDEGVYDWAMRSGAVTGRAKVRGDEPQFVATFSSAIQEHYHYQNGHEQAQDSSREIQPGSRPAI